MQPHSNLSQEMEKRMQTSNQLNAQYEINFRAQGEIETVRRQALKVSASSCCCVVHHITMHKGSRRAQDTKGEASYGEYAFNRTQ